MIDLESGKIWPSTVSAVEREIVALFAMQLKDFARLLLMCVVPRTWIERVEMHSAIVTVAVVATLHLVAQ